MRTSMLLSLVFFPFWLSPARSQPLAAPGGGPPFPPGPPIAASTFMLSTEKSVQDDLKMTAEQKAKISVANTKVQNAMKAEFNAAARPDQLMKKIQEKMQIADKHALDLLNQDQQKRIKQIVLQVQGCQAFSNAEVAKNLKLSKEQQTQIKSIQDGIGQQIFVLFQGQKLDPQSFQKKMIEIKKKADDQAVKVLTSEQATQWSSMIGAPFAGEIRTMPPFGPPPGFAPPPGAPPKK